MQYSFMTAAGGTVSENKFGNVRNFSYLYINKPR